MSLRRLKHITRKRSFLLFEIVLSMALLILCLIPLLKTHVGIAQEEGRGIRELKEEREARRDFCILKTRLYEHQVPWEKLMGGVEIEGFFVKKMTKATKRQTHEIGLVLQASRKRKNKEYQQVFYVEKARPLPH